MENVLKHKSGSYSGTKGFSKCPEIVFSELKKGLVRTLVENMCQLLIAKKNMQIYIQDKTKQAKTNEPNQHQVHTFSMFCIDFYMRNH